MVARQVSFTACTADGIQVIVRSVDDGPYAGSLYFVELGSGRVRAMSHAFLGMVQHVRGDRLVVSASHANHPAELFLVEPRAARSPLTWATDCRTPTLLLGGTSRCRRGISTIQSR